MKPCAVLAYGPPGLSHANDIYRVIITYRYPVKDKTSAKHLRRMAGAVNYAWNYCCQVQREADSHWRNGANRAWLAKHFKTSAQSWYAASEIRER